ncbi:hypothetical protein TEA_019268 [Camellia sinensis var. sinensis]|uniref:Uncharacterized protein n=1 Tax=Camellia sinensis var. sinensis TaxID=542762 RepID=A0A4S4F155_CAMSN|nr:hypothetical protein TEA_019268 [Camellia sinensis var. sinensis]
MKPQEESFAKSRSNRRKSKISKCSSLSTRPKNSPSASNPGTLFQNHYQELETQNELGRAEGLIRVWFGGRVLHLDSIRLRKETLGMKRSIFGIGLFIGAVAIRYGYECGCRSTELLAIDDSELYHSEAPFPILC